MDRSDLRPRRRGASLAIALALAVTGPAPLAARKTWDFGADEPGKLARGFTAEVGTWAVADDDGDRVLAQTARNVGQVYNLAIAEGTHFKDLELSVRVKAIAGEEDRGGGFAWRARDKDNYYVARYNPLEDNLRLYKVEGGKRTQLDHADAPGDGAWHTLRITMNGREILGYLDGKKLLEAEDSTFPDAGKVGLWSKADARTYFDDLTVEGE